MVYIGLESEFTLLSFWGTVVLGIWGAILLSFGKRLPQLTVGSFFLTVGFFIAYSRLSAVNYLLVIAAAILVLAIGIAIYNYVPRLGMAIAAFWPFAAVYGAYRFFEGWMNWDFGIAIPLMIAGVAMGITFPNISLAILSSALATILLAIALPIESTFWMVLVIFLAGIAWQLLILPRIPILAKWWLSGNTTSSQDKGKQTVTTVKWGAIALITCFILTAFLAPQPDISESRNPQRFNTLSERGELDNPGFIFSNEDAYYLFNRPLPVSLVRKENSFWNRFSVLIFGRSARKDIHQVRAIKDTDELETLRKAAAITSKAFETIAPLIRPGVNEADIEAEIHRVYKENGATGRAFNCIVGSGANAVKPHYGFNDAEMSEGLVVIDIGCSLNNYASDMTRTFAINGEPTTAEQHLLETVLAAADSARAHLKAGAKMSDLHRRAKAVINDAGFGPYFIHGLGHHVGLNVHDPYADSLTAGMVLTIEPGIYIPAGTAEVDSAYWNLGVRIEDTYIITDSGYEEITHYPKIPQTVTAMKVSLLFP